MAALRVQPSWSLGLQWPGRGLQGLQVEEFWPKSHRPLRHQGPAKVGRQSSVGDRVMLRIHLFGPLSLLRKMNWQMLLQFPFHAPGVQVPR